MENLRLLSNLETRKHKLIQIVLSGQPELDAKLKQPELRQLAQRISVRRWINTLTEEESYAYVQHRLNASDYKGPSLFGRKALEMIYEYSGGIPRKINILCDNALLIGYALKKRRIDADCVAEAAGDLNWAPIPKASDHAPATALAPVPQFARKGLRFRIALAGGMALAVGLVVAAWTNFGKSGSTFWLRNLPLSESIIQAKVNPVQDTERKPVPQDLSIPEAKGVLTQQAGPASMANERGVAESVMDTKEGRKREKLLMQSSELEKENLVFPAETPSEQKLPLPMKSAVAENPAHFSLKTVIVQRDDVLSKIILRAYGRYDEGLLTKVLKENPGIPTPDYIFVGQVIKLPKLESKQLNQFD
jgi:general secretion pathway protein A